MEAESRKKFDFKGLLVGRRVLRIVSACFGYLCLSVLSLVMLYPLIYMFLAGFFTAEEYNTLLESGEMGLIPIPTAWTVKNYLAIFALSDYPMLPVYFLNSLARTVYSTGLTVITVMMCGYAFSRLRFKGSRVLLLGLLFCSMMPGTMTLVPTFIMYSRLGMYDTWWVYLIGGPAINVMGTFVMKQYLDAVPVALDESAKIDGANTAQIIFRILLPVSKPMVTYIIITTAMSVWNDWSTGFFYTESDYLQLLPSAISQLALNAANSTTHPDYPLIITLGLIVTIPALVLYLVFQKYIVEGLAHVGIKG